MWRVIQKGEHFFFLVSGRGFIPLDCPQYPSLETSGCLYFCSCFSSPCHNHWLHKTIKQTVIWERETKGAKSWCWGRVREWVVIRAVLPRTGARDDTRSSIALIPKKCSPHICCGSSICLYQAISALAANSTIGSKNCLEAARSKSPWLVNGVCQGLLADYGEEESLRMVQHSSHIRRPHTISRGRLDLREGNRAV